MTPAIKTLVESNARMVAARDLAREAPPESKTRLYFEYKRAEDAFHQAALGVVVEAYIGEPK